MNMWQGLITRGGYSILPSHKFNADNLKLGDYMVQLKDLSGKKFHMLTVIDRAPNRNGRVMWNCVCDCGNLKSVYSKTLISGRTKSCGCLHIAQSIKNLPDNRREIGAERVHGHYVEVKTEKGWRRRHVLALELFLGRELEPGEVGHHCDGDKKNDSIDNIELMLHGEHTRMHHKGSRRRKETRVKISQNRKGKTTKENHCGWIKGITKDSLSDALASEGSVAGACRLLGICRRTYYNRKIYYEEGN